MLCKECTSIKSQAVEQDHVMIATYVLCFTVSVKKDMIGKIGHVDTAGGPGSPILCLVLFSSRTNLSRSIFHLCEHSSTDDSPNYYVNQLVSIILTSSIIMPAHFVCNFLPCVFFSSYILVSLASHFPQAFKLSYSLYQLLVIHCCASLRCLYCAPFRAMRCAWFAAFRAGRAPPPSFHDL